MFHSTPLEPVEKIVKELHELEDFLLCDDYADPDDWAEVREAYEIMYNLQLKILDIPF